MTRRVLFSAEARFDAQDIGRFGAERFGARGRAYVIELRAACKRLGDMPEIAPVYPDVSPTVRVLVHQSHRIFYRVEPTEILIVRILHQAQATPTAL